MAFIPISPAHQIRWRKTKPFPPGKDSPPSRDKHNTLSRKIEQIPFTGKVMILGVSNSTSWSWNTLRSKQTWQSCSLSHLLTKRSVQAKYVCDPFTSTSAGLLYFTILTFSAAFHPPWSVLEEPSVHRFFVLRFRRTAVQIGDCELHMAGASPRCLEEISKK